MVLFNIACSSKPAQRHKANYGFDFKNADMEGLLMYLLDYDFSSCFHSNDIEHVWAIIKRAVLKAMDLHIPQVKVKAQKQPKWFTSDIRHHLNCLRSLRKRNKVHPTEQTLSRLKTSEELLQDKIQAARASYETNLICSAANGNASLIFKHIRNITGHNAIPSTVTFETTTATSDYEKAFLFNSYFHSVITQSSFVLPSINELSTPASTLSDIFVTELDVYTALASLGPTKAGGIDGLGPRVLKFCLQHCINLFTTCLPSVFYNITFQRSGVFIVLLLHISQETGLQSRTIDQSHYSLQYLRSWRKSFSMLLLSLLLNISHPHSLAFFEGIHHYSNYLFFLHNILSSSSHSDVVYLDFKKAFDSVFHNELLAKLWKSGITGNLWNWFRGYLLHRSQCVCINRVFSSTLPVISGVPQGSILGPLLFLVFVNDLPMSAPSCRLLLFADNAKCVKSINGLDDYRALQQDLHNLTSWSYQWDLHFNESKCALLRFTPRSVDPSYNSTYFINNYPVATKESHKDLGVLISKDLSWEDHYNYMLSKAYKTFGLLHRPLAKALSIHTKKILYISLV